MFQWLGDERKGRGLQITGSDGDSQAFHSSRREHSKRREWPTLVAAAGRSGKMREETRPLDFTVWESLVSLRQSHSGTEEKESGGCRARKGREVGKG